MGTPAPAAATLEALLEGPDRVVGVVTQPDRPAGRGQQTVKSPVRRVAEANGIAVLAPEKTRDPAFLQALTSWAPDAIVVVAYGRILPRSILELAPQGCINVHYSLLPKYRGAAPIPWAIINGEEVSGVTTMRLVEKMDAGPIYLQEEVALAKDETAASLTQKLVPVGARLLLKTIAGLKAGEISPRAQDEDQASYAPLIKKEDGRVNWQEPASVIERRVRAFSPWPSCYTRWNGKLLKIHKASVVSTERRGAPGEIVRADRGGLWVATGEGVLSLDEVQLENRDRLLAAEFLKGARIDRGQRL
ncbi:MAG TPA: methionyl-tRNA formyltransferase [Candidatus Acidoferrales bacterium]|nr:methionyl-tRNA formyltransferase [Candidatus Acidoferrales bacterium]